MKIFTFLLLIFCLCSLASAEEITILYTGQTHAMIYPCRCPHEPYGGVARRAALIKDLKKKHPHTLLLDSGDFFAGGLLDDYTQNTQLDRQRTLLNLAAMELMRYDAVLIGDAEFNFGRNFLQENIERTRLAFLSCNVVANQVSPYTIKEFAGVKVGIIAVTGLSTAQKAEGLKIIAPKPAVKKSVKELKEEGVDIIVFLSQLSENENISIAEEISDIDVLIEGRYSNKEGEKPKKVESTLIIRPSWQGRNLGKLSLRVENNEIMDYKAEELPLSEEIRDDLRVQSILPICFSDADCKKKGFEGACKDAGTIDSRCHFSKAKRIKLLVIAPKKCRVCDAKPIIDHLEKYFPSLVVSYLYYPSGKAKKMIRDFSIDGLPAYLLDEAIEEEKGFANLKENLERKGNFYMLKPRLSGFSYFQDRKRIKGELDLFLSLFDKDIPQFLNNIKDFDPAIHFLAVEGEDGFDSPRGNIEVEECLRGVCVQAYYPEYFWDYISCRAKNINSTWWQDCLNGRDPGQIETCARSSEGKGLLRANIRLNKELEVMFGPTFLLDNQEIFGAKGVPSKEELEQLIMR